MKVGPVRFGAGLAVGLAMGFFVAALPALGSWGATAVVGQAVITSATLQPASGLTADCVAVLGVGQVTLDWTATSSTFATGHQVWRRINGGAWVQRASVTPRTTVTYLDSLGLLSLLLGATIDYEVTAYRGNWTSSPNPTATVNVTVLGLC